MTKIKYLPLEEKLRIPVEKLPLSPDTKKFMVGCKTLGGILSNYNAISRGQGGPGYNMSEVCYLLISLLFVPDTFKTFERYHGMLQERYKGFKKRIDSYVNQEV